MNKQNDMLRVFIGYDPRQAISYNVLQHSIATRSSRPVQITPLILQQLPLQRQGLTPFTYSRFLVPWLCNYEGWALFLDADMLLLDDISKLFDLVDDQYAMMCIKSEHKFEWPSVMLFNCAKCTQLTPESVEDPANKMFDFHWIEDKEIGALPTEWNHLVGYDPKREGVSLVHYTQGVPIFPELQGCEYSAEWNEACAEIISFESWETLMGNSVHATELNGKKIPKLRVKELVEEALELREQIMTNTEEQQDKKAE